MALVLSTWIGQKFVFQDKTCLQVYTKLGGKHIGQVELRKASKALFEQVKDLQEQVSKLLVHPTRTSNYLSLELCGFKLPSFTYRDEIDQASAREALKRLEECKSNSQLECMYDEDDSQALSKVQSAHYLHSVAANDFYCSLYVNGAFVPEIKVLKYTHKPTRIYLRSTNRDIVKALDCSPLRKLTNLEHLDFSYDYNVKDWEFARHLPLKHLELGIEGFNNINFECLPLLEELSVKVPYDRHIDLRMPARLPTTLKVVYFPWGKPPNLPTWGDLEAAFQGDVCTLVVRTSL
jgi:hypothetical protein